MDMVDKNDFLLCEFSSKTHICPRTYVVVFRFVPCHGPFDPTIDEHLCNIKTENDLPTDSIIAASWCKHPERRSPNEATTTLKVVCANPDAPNRLLTGHIWVDDHLLNVRKDICIPIKC